LPNPVFVGDTLYAQTEVLQARLSNSRPGTGIISGQATGYNQSGQVIMTYKRSFLVKSKGYNQGKLPQFGAQN